MQAVNRDERSFKERNTTEVHIDVAMRGLGTGACGPDTLPKFIVGAGTHRFTWLIKAT